MYVCWTWTVYVAGAWQIAADVAGLDVMQLKAGDDLLAKTT
jgi:hypothetical protein